MPGDLIMYLAGEFHALHRLITHVTSDLSGDQVNHVPAGGHQNIAFSLWHYVRTEDNILRFIIQGRKPTVWMEGGWSERLGLPPVSQGTGMSSEDAQALRIADLDAFKQYTQDVWQSTASWLANPDASVFDTIVTVKPLGEMPAIRALGQVCMTHGFTHLGELELSRTLLGLKPAIGV